jgi:hypothetical protein
MKTLPEIANLIRPYMAGARPLWVDGISIFGVSQAQKRKINHEPRPRLIKSHLLPRLEPDSAA